MEGEVDSAVGLRFCRFDMNVEVEVVRSVGILIRRLVNVGRH